MQANGQHWIISTIDMYLYGNGIQCNVCMNDYIYIFSSYDYLCHGHVSAMVCYCHPSHVGIHTGNSEKSRNVN